MSAELCIFFSELKEPQNFPFDTEHRYNNPYGPKSGIFVKIRIFHFLKCFKVQLISTVIQWYAIIR